MHGNVENGSASHTLTILPLFGWLPEVRLFVASDMRIRAYASSIGNRFVFGDALRIQAWVCLRKLALASGIWFSIGRLVCTCGKALRMQECAIVFGPRGSRESREKSGSTVRSAGKSWKPGGGKVIVFLLVFRECSRGEERFTSSSVCASWIDMRSLLWIYTPVIALS